MKRTILAVALMSAFAANATQIGGTTNEGGDATAIAGGGSANAVAGGGTGIGVGVGIAGAEARAGAAAGAISGSAVLNNTRNDVDVRNSSFIGVGVSNDVSTFQGQNQGQDQGQKQGQDQGQKQAQSADNKGNSQTINQTYNGELAQRTVTSNGRVQIANVPNVYAPSVYPTAPCMGSSSAGGSGVGFGFSVGTSWTDDECGIRETARSFANMGMGSDALSVLCSSKYAANAPSCAKPASTSPSAAVDVEPVRSAQAQTRREVTRSDLTSYAPPQF